MDCDIIRAPKDGLISFTPKNVEEIRKACNIDKKADREEAVALLDKWIKEQDHFMKKDFSKRFLEVCLVTSKGSIERAKQQIDKLCTMRAQMPQYFVSTGLKDGLLPLFEKGSFCFAPKLTDDNYRVIIVKINNGAHMTASEFILFYRLLVVTAEYLKHNDYNNGMILVSDYSESSPANVLPHMNLSEMQQFVSMLTQGFGARIKGLVFITASKFIEGFIKVMKTFYSAKIGSRIHAIGTREALKDLVNGDVLPKEYGGSENTLQELSDKLFETFSSPQLSKLLEEMKGAVTDESKRQNKEEFTEMSGTFRNLNVD
ncbi:uncharacterized protein LOC142981612 [Anticarsia gemmatalis]|uniref:uncharacterized protein LOC142981612 n=1 Tax=Anticarsia gemmatalis TaxID=129554 RepID=UPI003F764941